jgi:hypothetical protein
MNQIIRTFIAIMLMTLLLTSSVQVMATPGDDDAPSQVGPGGDITPVSPKDTPVLEEPLSGEGMPDMGTLPEILPAFPPSPARGDNPSITSSLSISGEGPSPYIPVPGNEGWFYRGDTDHRAPAKILLVDDDNSDDTNTTSKFDNGGDYTMDTAHLIDAALTTKSLDHDLYVVASGSSGPDFETMASYSAIIWCFGYEWGYKPTLTMADYWRITSFLDAGGSMWFTGSAFLSSIYGNVNRTKGGLNDFEDDDFARKYLGVKDFIYFTGQPNPVNGSAGAVMVGTEQYATRSFFDQFGDQTDILGSITRPVATGTKVLIGDSRGAFGNWHNDEPVAIAYDSGTWKAVTSHLDPAVISSNADRADLVGKVMAWMGTPALSLAQHSIMNSHVTVKDQSPIWTSDFNNVYWGVGRTNPSTGGTWRLYSQITATVHTHEDMEITAVYENHGSSDETNMKVVMKLYNASGSEVLTENKTASVDSTKEGQVTFKVKPTRAGFYTAVTNITLATDPRTEDNAAGAIVRVAEWLDDLENGTSDWTAKGAWKLDTGSSHYNTPTHGYYWTKTGTTTVNGDDLIAPEVDLRFYNTSFSHPIFGAGTNIIMFHFFFKGRLYGTGQDYVDLRMTASNLSGWNSLFKISGSTPGDNNVPGDFEDEWWRFTMGIYLGDYAGQKVQLKWTFVKRNQVSNSWWAVDDFVVWMHEELNHPPWIINATPTDRDIPIELGQEVNMSVFAVDQTDDPFTYEWTEDGEVNTTWTTNRTRLQVPLNSTEAKYQAGHTLNVTVTLADDLDTNWTSWNIILLDPIPRKGPEFKDNITIQEDVPGDFDFGMADNVSWFRDIQGQEFTVTSMGSAQIKVSNMGNNVLRFENRVDHWFGEDNITLIVTDEADAKAYFNLTVVVDPVNDAPVLTDATLPDGTQDEGYTFFVSASDVDDPVDGLTFQDDSDLFSIRTTDGRIMWTPLNEHVGFHTFNITVTDPHGAFTKREYTIFVNNVNDPPVLRHIATQTVYQGQVFTINLSDYLEDADLLLPAEYRDFHTFRDDTAKVDTNLETGEVIWDAPGNYDVGDFIVTFTVTDSKGQFTTQEVRITVLNVNDAPKIGIISKQVLHQDSLYSFDVPFEDIDMDVPGSDEELVFSNDNTELFFIDPATGHIQFTPGNGHVGVWEVNITVTDVEGAQGSRLVYFEVINENDAPEIEYISVQNVVEDVPFELQVVATDIDLEPRLVDGEMVNPDEELSFRTNSTRVLIDAETGLLSFTPTNDDAKRGSIVVRVTVVDGDSETSSVDVLFNVEAVNDAPDAPSLIGVYEGMELWTHETYTFAGTSSDIDNVPEELTFTWYREDSIIGMGSSLEWSPWVLGPSEVRLAVSDPDGGEASTSVNVVVKKLPPPVPRFDPLLNRSTLKKGDTLELVLEFPEGSIPEGEVYDITVSSNVSGDLATRKSDENLTIAISDLEPGDHRITVTVTDGTKDTTTWFDTTVKKKPSVSEESGTLIWVILIVAVVAIVVALLFFRQRMTTA